MTGYKDARTRMVDSQLRPNSVTDRRILSVMGELERERFVPANCKALAYLDREVPLHDSRVLMSPMYLARLIQLADITSADLVLDVACGTGYSTAVIAKMADAVVALDEDESMVSQAAETLSDMGIDNIAVVSGAFAEGYASEGPYDVIVINGEIEFIPDAYIDQLREGGRLVAVVRKEGVGRATLYRKVDGKLGAHVGFDATVSPLPGFARTPEFVF